MNSSDDSLNDDATLPRPDGVGTGGASTKGNDLDGAVTIRMPGMGMMMFQRYKLIRTLGRGGMGVVWLAEDTKLNRQVALKFLPDIIGADDVALHELMEETRRGLDLAHPNIVRIYDLVSDAEMAAISMEFVNGKNLSERRLTQPNRVFTVEDVRPWLGQLCSALDYAHFQKKIVHRDLKPANLMLTWDGELKVTDFGIARTVSDSVSRLSRANHTSGTLPYMSPQQVMGERSRPTDDVYSLGATLYDLFTGKPPFYSGDVNMQITQKVPPLIRERREDLEVGATDAIPDDWEAAVAACLDKDPKKRPQSAGELARMLGVSTNFADHGAAQKPQLAEKLGLAGAAPAGAVPATARTAPTSSTTNPFAAQFHSTHATSPTTVGEPRKKPVALAAIVALSGVALLAAVAGAVWWTSFRAGSWVIETEPAGAKVTMGERSSVSPATLESLKPGTHKATLSLDGYEPRDIEAEVGAGERVNKGAVKLDRSSGQLLLSSDPEESTYEVTLANDTAGKNGKFTGKTPDTVKLPVGIYTVTMKHNGETQSADVKIARHDEARQVFTFDKPANPTPAPSFPLRSTTPTLAASVTPATTPAPLAHDPPTLALAGAPPSSVTMAAAATPAPKPGAGSSRGVAEGPPETAVPAAGASTTLKPRVSAGTAAVEAAIANVVGTLAVPSTQPLVATATAAPMPQSFLPASLDATAPPQMIASQPPAQAAVAAPQSGSMITADPTNTLPAGPTAPGLPGVAPGPGQAAVGPTSAPPTQPTLAPPEAGYWKLGEILQNSEYRDYSEAGRGYVVYKAQQMLKQSADGVPGKGTYKAVQQFQTDNGLQPNGQLDSATLLAMKLNGQADKSDWGRGSGRRVASSGEEDEDEDERTPESEKTKFRKMLEKNVFKGKDLKDVFRGR